MSAPLLDVRDVHAHIGDSHILQGVSLDVMPGEVVALLGRNGAGKTTTLRTIMGLLPPRGGRISFDGSTISGKKTHDIARAGLGFVQETRAIFPSLSVTENLAIAARRGASGEAWTIERCFTTFPNLAARRDAGGTKLSGGEQQMLAIARALVGNPRLLLLDEPSEGLAPQIVRQIGLALRDLRREGMTMLLVEQNFALAMALADRIVVLGKGRVRWSGTPAELSACPEIRQKWIGV